MISTGSVIAAAPAGDIMRIMMASADIQGACPAIVGVTIGDPNDKATWNAQFASAPSELCTAVVQTIFTSYQPPPTFVALTSSGTPALNGNYAIDNHTQQNIQAISIYVAVNGRFPNGQSSQLWPDVNGTFHSFTSTAQWLAFATGVADFVAALQLGQAHSNTITIP